MLQQKHSPVLSAKLSRTPGVKPQPAMLKFGETAWNIADGTLYGKVLDEDQNEIIIPIAGNGLIEWLKEALFNEIEIAANQTHIIWKYANSDEWNDIVALEDISGVDGREIILSASETHITFKYEGDSEFQNLVALSELKGQDADNIELAVSTTHIIWKLQGNASWNNLIALDQITGTDGEDAREILISENDTHILWKYHGDPSWNNLLEKHPTGYSSQPEQALTGNQVISKINVSDKGHVTGIETREIQLPHANATVSEDITAALEVGGIAPGDVVQEGTSLTALVKQLLLTTFFPSLIAPSGSLSLNFASQVEAGYSGNATLTFSFDRGQIRGNMVDGVWNPTAFQNHRAGAATAYVFNGTNNGLSNQYSIGLISVGDETLSYAASVSYSQGVQPLDSEGNNYSSPLPGGSIAQSASVTGRRRLFFGHSSSADSSDAIRGLQSSSLNPLNGHSFTLSAPAGATNIVIAYPAILRNLSSVVHVEGMNAEISNQFTSSLVSVNGLNGFTAISYKVFVLSPVAPLQSSATFNCTI